MIILQVNKPLDLEFESNGNFLHVSKVEGVTFLWKGAFIHLLPIYFLWKNDQFHHHMENREVVDHKTKFVTTCFIVHLHDKLGKREVNFDQKNIYCTCDAW